MTKLVTPQSDKLHKATETSGGWPISVTVATVVIASMLMVALAVMTLGWMGARSALVTTATRTASDSGILVNERARRMLEPVQATLRQISFDPIASAKTLDERLDRLFVLSEELTANGLLSSLYVGYQNGEFILVRALDKPALRTLVDAPKRANFLVQARTRIKNEQTIGEYLFYNADGKLIERRQVPGYTFDPRTRPWFKNADSTTAAVMSDPYVFFTTRQIGITISQLSRDGGAVFGIDVVLDELSLALGDLRVTPGAQIALINEGHEVLAYPDMTRTLSEANGQLTFKTIQALGEPSLIKLAAENPPFGTARFFEVAGRDTLGIILPFEVWQDKKLKLLVTVPEEELMGDLAHQRRKLLWLVLGIVVLMLPLGWMAGRKIGRSLDRLTDLANRLGRFDFTKTSLKPSFVREVNALNHVMADMSHTIQSFLNLSRQMATEPSVDDMIDQVLHQLVQATRCEAAAVYLWDHQQHRMIQSAVEGYPEADFSAGFPYPDGRESQSALRSAADGVAVKEVELRGRTGQLQGLLVLVHKTDANHSNASFLDFANQLSGMLAVSVETRQLIESQKGLLDGVIRLMADAIDAKSPYTGGHCERVPALATLMVERMCADTTGPYAAFQMNEDERYEFRLGAWLHDCGKVTSPEHIVDKATKLEVIYNRIHEIRMRFEVLWRDAEIEHFKRVASGIDVSASQTMLQDRQRQLQIDFEFVAQCNAGTEFMADDSIDRLQVIANQTWLRHFDNRLGVSIEEARRMEACHLPPSSLPAVEPLLADRPEHIVPWEGRRPPVEKHDPLNKHGFDMSLPVNQQNKGELHNLTVRRGTLTAEDRFKINDHIVQTYVMLKSLPWPQQLARVPEIAASHHEKMDGKGYPRKLPAQQLTSIDRVMAIADIFEALTAADRPYKAVKTVSESLWIMAMMCKDMHIDTEMFRYFLNNRIWETFAQGHIDPAQIDEVDMAEIESILPQTRPESAQPVH